MSTVRTPYALGWLTTVTALGVLDYMLDRRHDGSTLSECTRWLFRTESTLGKSAFTAAMAAGTYVLHQHIVKPVVSEIEDVLST